MWAVENYKGLIEAEFETEDEAWEYVMRRELNYVPDADQLIVTQIVEDEDALIENLLATT